MADETYVDEFLLARAAEADQPFEGPAVVKLIVDEYREAINSRKWPTATALGKVMLRLAEQCKEHHDYRPDWQP